jgi:hypothetical protein
MAEPANRSLRVLIEEGLRLVLGQRRGRPGKFRLRRASFAGEGLQPGLDQAGSGEIRCRAYEGRGE